MDWVYLDNNATTQPAPQVVAAMAEVHARLWANPSSVHRFGQMARQRVELARNAVAALIGARDREIVFTSGGTEANNLALRGVLEKGLGFRVLGVGEEKAVDSALHPKPDTLNPVLITTPIEHSAIRQPAEELAKRGVRVVRLAVDRDGRVNPADVAAELERVAPGSPVLVSVQWANNETGVIQPVEAIGRVVREHHGAGKSVLFHIDATQAVGKIPVDVKAAGCDLLTLSAHKFHGPKGAGALFVRTGVRLQPQQWGGPQERDRRGGTENTAGIVGMGVAAELAKEFVADAPAITRLAAMRDRFERGVIGALPEMGVVINSGGVGAGERLWNTSNLAFPRIEAEAILLGLSERGVCASAGAACSSGSLEPSPVLLAMGIPEPLAHGSVRFSLSRFTTDAQIDQALLVVPEVVRRLMQTLPTPV